VRGSDGTTNRVPLLSAVAESPASRARRIAACGFV